MQKSQNRPGSQRVLARSRRMTDVSQLMIPSREQNGTQNDEDRQITLDNAQQILRSTLEEVGSEGESQSLTVLYGLLELYGRSTTNRKNRDPSIVPSTIEKRYRRRSTELSCKSTFPKLASVNDEPSFSSSAEDISIQSTSLAISSFLSFVYLRKVLQLAQSGYVHPVIVYVLNHSSTLARLNQFKSNVFSQHLTWKWLEHSLDLTVSASKDRNNKASASLLLRQQDVLSLVGLTVNHVSNAAEQIKQILRINSDEIAIDLLLAFLLRRQLTGSKTIPISDHNPYEHNNSPDLLSILHLKFSSNDITCIDWTSATIRSELLMILVDEFQAFLDCTAIILSMDRVEPSTLLSMNDDRTSSRTQRFYAWKRQKWGNELIPSKYSIDSLQQLTLYILQQSVDIRVIQNSLWDSFQNLAITNPHMISQQLKRFIVGGSENLEEESGIIAAENSTTGLNTSSPSFDELLLIQFRLMIQLQYLIISCLTSVVRYHPQLIQASNANHMAEFIVERQFIGLLGDLLIRQEDRTIAILISLSPSLIPVVSNLAIASSLFVVSLHQLHEQTSLNFYNQSFDSPAVYKFHDLFIHCLSRHTDTASQCLSTDLQFLCQIATNVTLLSHAMLCVRLSYESSTGEATPRTPRPEPLRSFADSLPERLEKAAFAFEQLQAGHDLFTTASDLSSGNPKFSVLWHHSFHSIYNPEVLHSIALTSPSVSSSAPCSSSGVLRVVLFDLIESVLLSVNLSTASSVYPLLILSADLCETEECVAERIITPRNSIHPSFWSIVIEQYLTKYIPYSLPVLSQLITSIFPKTPDCPSSQQRFTSIISLLSSPITTICIPPISPNIIPYISGQLRQLDDHDSADSSGKNESITCCSSVESVISSLSMPSEQCKEWDWQHYVLTSPLVFQSVLSQLVGVPITSSCTLSSGITGLISPMPIQLPSSLFSYESTEIQSSLSPYIVRRRYRGCVWAVHTMTTSYDSPQSVISPINPDEFRQFDEAFDAAVEKQLSHSRTFRSSRVATALIPNPFIRNISSDDEEGVQRLLTYEKASLQCGVKAPYTVQFDLTSSLTTSQPPSLLELYFDILNGALNVLDAWEEVEEHEGLLVRINLLITLLKLFNRILNCNRSCRPVLERLLSRSFLVTPTTFQRQMIRSLTVSIGLLESQPSILTTSSIRLLIKESVDGLLSTLQPITLDNLQKVLAQELDVATLLWECWHHDYDNNPQDIQKLGYSPDTIDTSWYFRLCLTSSSSFNIDGFFHKWSSIDILKGLRILLQPNRYPWLTLSMVNSIIFLIDQFLRLSPISLWNITPVEEAMISSQRTLSAIEQLVKLNPSNWNYVKNYMINNVKEIHRIRSTVLSTPTQFLVADDPLLEGNLPVIHHGIHVIFNIIWQNAISATSDWNVQQRLYLLNSLIPLLNNLISNFSIMNSTRFDIEATRVVNKLDRVNETDLFRQEIRRMRFVQNALLQALSEHNVVGVITSLLYCDGYFTLKLSNPPGLISLNISSPILNQVYFKDLIDIAAENHHDYSIEYNQYFNDGIKGLDLGHKVLRKSIQFMITLLAVVSTDRSTTENNKISQLFSKLSTSLISLLWSSSISLVKSYSISLMSNIGGSIQLAVNDPFESTNREMLLNLNFERSQYSWETELTFIFSLIHWSSVWSFSNLNRIELLVLVRLLITSIMPKSDNPKLLPQILVQFPGELIGYLTDNKDGNTKINSKAYDKEPKSSSMVLRKTISSLDTLLQSMTIKYLISYPCCAPLYVANKPYVTSGDLTQLIGLQSICLTLELLRFDPTFLRITDSPSLLSLIGSSFAQILVNFDLKNVSVEAKKGLLKCTLSHQDLILVHHALLLLIEALQTDSNGELLKLMERSWMTVLQDNLFWRVKSVSSASSSPVPSVINIQALSAWSLLRQLFLTLLHLWDIIEEERYKCLPQRLPYSDLYYIETIRGYIGVPTKYHQLVFKPVIASNQNIFGYFLVDPTPHQRTSVECSFLSLPLIIECLNSIVQVVVEQFKPAAFHTTRVSVNRCLADVSQGETIQTPLPTSKLSQFPLPSTATETPKRRKSGVSPQLVAALLSAPFSSNDFMSLYKAITMADAVADLLLKVKKCSTWMKDEIKSTSLLIPNPLLPELCEELRLSLASSHLDAFVSNVASADAQPLDEKPDINNYLSSLIKLLFDVKVKSCKNVTNHRYTSQSTWKISPLTGSSNCDIILERQVCHQMSYVFMHHHLTDTHDDVIRVKNAWINLLELVSLTSIELCIYRSKHQLLNRLTTLLSSSRHHRIFPLIIRPLSNNSNETNSNSQNPLCKHQKPFQCYVIPSLKLLSNCFKDCRHDLWIARTDIIDPLPSNVSFGGMLLHFVIQLLSANWESDCRATTPIVISPSFPATVGVPFVRCDEEPSISKRCRFSSDISDISDNLPRRGSSHEEILAAKMLPCELLPRVLLHHKTTGCLSSIWQPECQARPSIVHPDGVWLNYPLCQMVLPIGGIDVLEIFEACDSPNEHETEVQLATPRVVTSSDEAAQVNPIHLFEQLISQVSQLCQSSIIIKQSPENHTQTILNLSDFARCLTFLHISVRISIALHSSIESINLSLKEFIPLVTSWLSCLSECLMSSSYARHEWLKELDSLLGSFSVPHMERELRNLLIPQIASLSYSSLTISIVQTFHSTVRRVMTSIEGSYEDNKPTDYVSALLLPSSAVFVNILPKLLGHLAGYRYKSTKTLIHLHNDPKGMVDVNQQHSDQKLLTSPLYISSIDLHSSAAYQSSLALISLITEFSQTQLIASKFHKDYPAQLFARLSGPDQYFKPIRVPLESSHRDGGNAADSNPIRSEKWRPAYECYLSTTSDEISLMTAPTGVVRARSHVVWCRALLCLVQLGRTNVSDNQASIRFDITIDTVLQFQDRMNFVFTAVKQTAQLALLEEMEIYSQLLSHLPQIQHVPSISNKTFIFRLAYLGLKSVQQFAPLVLGRGQIEIAELFKPTSVRELAAAGVEEEDGGCMNVPSIFHQRIFVLTMKIMLNFLTCFHRLSVDKLPIPDLQYIAEYCSNSKTSHIAMINSENRLHISSSPVSDDLLEALLHDIMDLGRLVLQLLEDLLKLEKQVFVGVRTYSSDLILPLSLSLRCEEELSSITSDIYTAITQENTEGVDLSPKGCTTKSFLPPPQSSLSLSTFNNLIDTPPPTPRLTAIIPQQSIPSDAQTVISRRSSPLVQRYASGTPIKGTKSNRGGSPIIQFSRVARISDFKNDPCLEGCLPEVIQFSSLVKLLQNIVEISLVTATQHFERLVANSKRLNIPFERPAIIRRLTEFFTSVKGSSLDRFKSRERLFRKMMTIIGWTLGDEIKLDTNIHHQFQHTS